MRGQLLLPKPPLKSQSAPIRMIFFFNSTYVPTLPLATLRLSTKYLASGGVPGFIRRRDQFQNANFAFFRRRAARAPSSGSRQAPLTPLMALLLPIAGLSGSSRCSFTYRTSPEDAFHARDPPRKLCKTSCSDNSPFACQAQVCLQSRSCSTSQHLCSARLHLMSLHILDRVGRRWAAVALSRDGQPAWQVAKKTGLTQRDVLKWVEVYDETGDVADAARAGRPRGEAALEVEPALSRLVAGGDNRRRSANSLAFAAAAEVGAPRALPASTVRVILADRLGAKWEADRSKTMLSNTAMTERHGWGTAHRDHPWRKTGITDSKYFLWQHVTSGKRKRGWQTSDTPSVLTVQKSYQVHAYAMITYNGISDLKFVTGTTGQRSAYLKPGTTERHPGVCGREYAERILPWLVQCGKEMLGDDYYFQHDKAKPHTSKQAKAKLAELQQKTIPWPTSGHDLSPIELLWAIAEQRLNLMNWTDFESFKQALVDVWSELQADKALYQNLMNGVAKRVRKLIKARGARLP